MNKKQEVILLKNFKVEKYKKGFVVNYLLPRGEVLLYNEKNIAWVERQKAKELEKNLLLEEKARDLYKKINNFTLNFVLKKDEKGETFGSVNFKEILQELVKSDFHLEKSQLLDFHPLNKLGENIVKVKLSSNVIAELKIIIK
jgi:ribosomal protein L9